MRLRVAHTTGYEYSDVAGYSIQYLRLTPRRDANQRVLDWQIRAPARLHHQADAFGNDACLLTVEGAHRSIEINVEGVVETDDGAAGRLADDGRLSPLIYLSPTALTGSSSEIVELAAHWRAAGPLHADELRPLMRLVTDAVAYRSGSSIVSDPAAKAIERGEGVCQDQAHVGIAVCRAAGIPARYVSGYLLAAGGDDPAAAATHAWFEVWLAAENCWVGCDVTHNCLAGANLCRLAVGRDYLDAAPVRGVRRGGGEEQLRVAVSVSDAIQQ